MSRLEALTRLRAHVDTSRLITTPQFSGCLNISRHCRKLSQLEFANDTNTIIEKSRILLTRLEAMMFHGVRNADLLHPHGQWGAAPSSRPTAFQLAVYHQRKIDDAMEKAYQNGGQPDLLVLNPGVARDLKDDVDNSNFVRLGYENTQVGMQPIQRVSTQYGQVQLVMSRWCPVSTAFVLQSGKVGLYDFRQFEWKELAMVGDSKRGEVVGEFSMLVANEKAHVKLTGITRWPESQS